MTLFRQTHLDQFYEELHGAIKSEVDRMPEQEILSADVEKLAADFEERYRVTCPKLGTDYAYDPPAFQPGVESYSIPIDVLFKGDERLFQCHHSSYPMLDPIFEVKPGILVVRMRTELRYIDKLKEQLDGVLNRVQDGLTTLDRMLPLYNKTLREEAARLIRLRQNEFQKHGKVLQVLQNTGFTLRKRDDEKQSMIMPVKQKTLATQSPPTQAKPKEPELSLADYDAILKVIQDMVKVFERSPRVFQKMEEEDLRTILLVALNGLFEGQATGETFNGDGKTDILIRVGNQNIFIAECLIWDGEAKLLKKLTEQLFNYATWRDSKLAAIVFNRRKNFTSVVQKMRELVAGLPNCMSTLNHSLTDGCRHRFRRQDDPQKEFVLSCMAFEVPS